MRRLIAVLGAAILSAACVRAGEPRIFQTLPAFALVDQDGGAVTRETLRGRAWIANFIFTRCESTCPIQTKDLAGLQKVAASNPHSDQIRFVSITVDPGFDTPTVLKAYGAKAGADFTRWYFLAGERSRLISLCRDGFKLPVDDPPPETGNITHSSQFMLVDPLGRIRGFYNVADTEDRTKMLADLDLVLAENPYSPDDLFATGWMDERRAAQIEAAKDYAVAHDFHFEDRLATSGITFRGRVVDDAGRDYKAVHYDHGSGIAAADVDGDGRIDLYFVNQVGGNELWRNVGGGKFENTTPRACVALADRICVGASFADVDNDGDADLFVTTVRGGNVMFLNDGKGNFSDVSKESGVDHVGHSSGAVFFDYNRDGLLDLLVCNVGQYTTDERLPANRGAKEEYFLGLKDGFAGHLHSNRTERCILYENKGGARFVDVTDKVGIQATGWCGDATAFDANADGWPDLVLLNMQGHNRYFENQGGRSFVDKSSKVFNQTPWGAMGVKAVDFDNDGNLDLYVTDMHSDMSQQVGPEGEKEKAKIAWPESFVRSGGRSIWGNAFYRGLGGGKFVEISDDVNLENYWPWGVSSGDFNADGFPDLFVTAGMSYPFRYACNKLLLNDHGTTFLDAEFVTGVEPRRDGLMVQPWFDLDCAGLDRANKLCAGADGTATVWAAKSTRSSVILDIEDDGDLDLVTNEFSGEPMVLVSDLSAKRKINFLKIRLRGTKSNRDAIGARVMVTSGRVRQLQVNDGKSGYLSQSSLPLYFGLGDVTQVVRVEVTWPNGGTSSVDHPAIGTMLEITEH